MKALGSQLAELWCRSLHPAPMWPVKGRYRCPVCLRSYPVPWEQPVRREAVVSVRRVAVVEEAETALAASPASAIAVPAYR
jgi:hypothetical protein